MAAPNQKVKIKMEANTDEVVKSVQDFGKALDELREKFGTPLDLNINLRTETNKPYSWRQRFRILFTGYADGREPRANDGT